MRGRLLVLLALTAACGGDKPEIDPLDDQVVAVGGELRLVITASTQGGGALSWSFTSDMPKATDRAQISQRPDGAGVFVLHPLASDVGAWHYSFHATGDGGSGTLTIMIEVKPAVGVATAPQIIRPLGDGTMLDLARDSCVDLDVEVEDADSTSVTLSQDEPLIEGATLTVNAGDKKKAAWHWCPTDLQIKNDDRYILRLGADDGENPPSHLVYVIVLRPKPGGGCAGFPSAPIITHTAQNASGVVDLAIAATVADELPLKRAPLLYHSKTMPAGTPSFTDGSWTQVEMRLDSGNTTSGVWKASVPNPVASAAAGTMGKVYYVIVAVDADDATGACNHTVQSPVYTMTVTSTGGAGGLAICEACTADAQCGGAADNCVRVGTGRDTFCLKACAKDGDCPTGYLCTPGNVTSVDHAMARQCVPASGACGAATAACADDAREENDSRAQAGSATPLASGAISLVSCPLDDDWYKIVLAADGKIAAWTAAGSGSDLDLTLYRADGNYVTTSRGPTSSEGLVRFLTAGTYYLLASARLSSSGKIERNPYTLNYAQVTGRGCTDDPLEDDDSRQQARPSPALWGTVSKNNQICTGDDDWFRADLIAGDTLILDLTFTQANPTQNLDLHVHDGNSVDLTPCKDLQPETCTAAQGQGSASNEHFELKVPATCSGLCPYYVRVHGRSGSEGKYDLRIDKDP